MTQDESSSSESLDRLQQMVGDLVPAHYRGDTSFLHDFLHKYRRFECTEKVLTMIFIR